jgi:hypothetical protein
VKGGKEKCTQNSISKCQGNKSVGSIFRDNTDMNDVTCHPRSIPDSAG